MRMDMFNGKGALKEALKVDEKPFPVKLQYFISMFQLKTSTTLTHTPQKCSSNRVCKSSPN